MTRFHRSSIAGITVFAAAGGCATLHAQTPLPEGALMAWGQDNILVNPPPATYRFSAVSAGWRHSLAIIANPSGNPNLPPDGTMVAWGINVVPGLATPRPGVGWKAVSAGYLHSLAIDKSGHVVAWGLSHVSNEYAGAVPDDLVNVSIIGAVEAGENLSVVLTTEGQLYFWGRSEAFVCSVESRPEQAFTEISAHGHHILARQASDGVVVPIGPNISGHPGGGLQNTNVPQPNNFGPFSAGHWHSIAANPDGTWYDQGTTVWGLNDWSQCQTTPVTNCPAVGCPGSICEPACYTPPPNPMPVFRQIEGGYFQTSGLTVYGGIVAWGRNDDRQCQPPYGRFKALSARFDHGLAIAACYPNCDGSTASPVLDVNDFVCFNNSYAAGDPSANCDGSTTTPVLNVNDFVCFQNAYTSGCS